METTERQQGEGQGFIIAGDGLDREAGGGRLLLAEAGVTPAAAAAAEAHMQNVYQSTIAQED